MVKIKVARFLWPTVYVHGRIHDLDFCPGASQARARRYGEGEISPSPLGKRFRKGAPSTDLKNASPCVSFS